MSRIAAGAFALHRSLASYDALLETGLELPLD